MSRTDNKPKPPRTLKALAEALGVSRTTVSNAFNRPDQLSDDLREHILDAARRHGYPGPNPMARKLRTGQANALGVLLGDDLPYAFTDAAAIAFLRGIAQVCQQVHAGVLILPVVDDPGEDRMIRDAAVDGFITYCLPDESPVVPALLERQLPIVTVEHAPIAGSSAVEIESETGARAAAHHLLELGHRRFAVLCLDLRPDGHQGPVTAERRARVLYGATATRLAGYEAALSEAAIDPTTVPLLECPGNDRAIARRLAKDLLGGEHPPTAILAMSDEIALGAMDAADELGLTVPGAVSVVGFDDTPAAALARPPLTTIRQPLTDKGCLAARLLLDAATGAAPDRRTLATELVVRGSTGPV